MRRRFVTLDVFTSRRFAGNPLAVVLDARGLDGGAMQAIAREFNLSETVFVLAAADPRHRAWLRIFTPAAELPFAGHPTVGSAVLLARLDGGAVRREIVVEEGIGPVRCAVEPYDAERGNARFDLVRLPAESGPAADAAAIAAALGLEAGDIGFAAFRPARWSAGLSMTFVPVRGLEAIKRCRPDLTRFDAAFAADPHGGAAYVYCGETVETGHAFHARMFAPRMGVAEDPATGSAAAAFAGLLARHAPPPDGTHAFDIEQGYEMGRPSVIRLAVTMQHGTLAAASIGGDAIVVSEGTIEA
jgi:trans-2,3-dihydro-3-hydroxyanthranilate isomerase